MSISITLVRKLDRVAPEIRDALLGLVDEVIEQHREMSVTKVEFNELKEIVRDLVQAQTRTEAEVAKLAVSHAQLRNQVGGLAQPVAYVLENEAYRKLPAYLSERRQLEVTERLVRTFVNEEEINFYARARRGNEAVLIVGESVSRLDDASTLGQLRRKLEAVRAVESLPLAPLLVTHFAHPKLLAQAEQEGIIVVQSFEW